MIALSVNMFYTTDPEELRDDASFNACLYILLAGCAFFSAIAQYYGIMGAGEKIVWKIRNQMFESIMRRSISYFDEADHGVGELTTMLAEYSHIIHKAFGESLAKQAMAISTLIVGVVLGFTASWKISLVVIATFPLNIAAAAVQMEAWQGQQ
jgi:ABC-type multidrug transport system fused ATPase/permease subunit